MSVASEESLETSQTSAMLVGQYTLSLSRDHRDSSALRLRSELVLSLSKEQALRPRNDMG
jgi:hypothetical protein